MWPSGLWFSACSGILHPYQMYRDNETAYAFPRCYHSLIIYNSLYYMHYICTLIPAYIQYKVWLHFFVPYSHICLVAVTSQLPSMSPWSSKDTARTSSPSSVDTVMFSFIPPGQCMCCIQDMSSCVHMNMSSIRVCVQPFISIH